MNDSMLDTELEQLSRPRHDHLLRLALHALGAKAMRWACLVMAFALSWYVAMRPEPPWRLALPALFCAFAFLVLRKEK